MGPPDGKILDIDTVAQNKLNATKNQENDDLRQIS